MPLYVCDWPALCARPSGGKGSSEENWLRQRGGSLGKERGLVDGKREEGALGRSPEQLPKCSVINKSYWPSPNVSTGLAGQDGRGRLL